MYSTMEQAQEVWTTYTKEIAELSEEIKVLKKRNAELEKIVSSTGAFITACIKEALL